MKRVALIGGGLPLLTVGAVWLATGRPVPVLVVALIVALASVAAWIESRRGPVQPQADEHGEPMGEKPAPTRGGGFEQPVLPCSCADPTCTGWVAACFYHPDRKSIAIFYGAGQSGADGVSFVGEIEICAECVEILGPEEEDDTCPRCEGDGRDPHWMDSAGDLEPCDDCGGLGVVVR